MYITIAIRSSKDLMSGILEFEERKESYRKDTNPPPLPSPSCSASHCVSQPTYQPDATESVFLHVWLSVCLPTFLPPCISQEPSGISMRYRPLPWQTFSPIIHATPGYSPFPNNYLIGVATTRNKSNLFMSLIDSVCG